MCDSNNNKLQSFIAPRIYICLSFFDHVATPQNHGDRCKSIKGLLNVVNFILRY